MGLQSARLCCGFGLGFTEEQLLLATRATRRNYRVLHAHWASKPRFAYRSLDGSSNRTPLLRLRPWAPARRSHDLFTPGIWPLGSSVTSVSSFAAFHLRVSAHPTRYRCATSCNEDSSTHRQSWFYDFQHSPTSWSGFLVFPTLKAVTTKMILEKSFFQDVRYPPSTLFWRAEQSEGTKAGRSKRGGMRSRGQGGCPAEELLGDVWGWAAGVWQPTCVCCQKSLQAATLQQEVLQQMANFCCS